MKAQIYKVGINWILWVPGVRVYRFARWQDAIDFVVNPAAREVAAVAAGSH